MIYRIHSRTNQRVKDLIKNKNRYFVFEGEKLVNDILGRGAAISVLIIDGQKEGQVDIPAGVSIEETWYVSGPVMEKISSLKTRPGIIAVLELKETPIDFKRSRVIIGLDGIQDPGNVGSIFRCAAAFGIGAIALAKDCVSLNNPKFLRAAQDSIFAVAHQRFPGIDALIRAALEAEPSLNIYPTSSRHAQNTLTPGQIEFPCLVLLGGEGQGLPEHLFEQYASIKIRQTDKVESLNVGVSACIIMYEIGLHGRII
jgi:TrmH family RNA methyltransferase